MRTLVAMLCLACGPALVPAGAVVPPDTGLRDPRLARSSIRHPDLDPSPVLRPVAALAERQALRRELEALGIEEGAALLDTTTSRWGTLRPSRPLIPRSGRGNDLIWGDLGEAPPRGDDAISAIVWKRLLDFLDRYREHLRVEPSELVPRFGVFEEGGLVQVSAERRVGGIAVPGARLVAVVRHGNLVLLGTELWGDSPPPARRNRPGVA
jgi:hypothetical protein